MIKYTKICEYIRNKIETGEFLPEKKIPSENKFTKLFNVSRNTVRKAIEELANEGILTSVHGKGVFVLKKIPIDFKLNNNESFKEVILKKNLDFKTYIPIFETIIVDENLSEKTHFNIGDKIFHIIRVRSIDDEKVILDDNYFLFKYLEGLTEEIAYDSIYEFIEKVKSLKIKGTHKIISIEDLTTLDKEYLDIKNSTNIAVVKNFSYLDNGVLFEYTESHHRPDKFIFTSFAKREKKAEA